jgi:hypothetical protein
MYSVKTALVITAIAAVVGICSLSSFAVSTLAQRGLDTIYCLRVIDKPSGLPLLCGSQHECDVNALMSTENDICIPQPPSSPSGP